MSSAVTSIPTNMRFLLKHLCSIVKTMNRLWPVLELRNAGLRASLDISPTEGLMSVYPSGSRHTVALAVRVTAMEAIGAAEEESPDCSEE